MIGVAVAVLGAGSVAPALAVADQSFVTSGSITYTWQGDPARGCAAVGVCDVQGELTLGSQGGFSSTSSGGRPLGNLEVPIDTSGSIVRVADGGGGECVDASSFPAPGSLLIARREGRLVGQIEAPLSSGRCAGPRQADLAPLLLPVKRRGGDKPMFDLRTTQRFVVGPFTGKLVSTLIVRSATTGGGSQGTSSGPVPAVPRPSRKVLFEQVTLRYGLASLPRSSLDASFSGESDPFCAALDSCGATGTLAFTLPHYDQTLVVHATRAVASRVDARQALADLRRGRLPLSDGVISSPRGGSSTQVTETFAGSGGLRCRETSRSESPQLFFFAGPTHSGRELRVALNESMGSDLLRTHCPGPSDADVVGNGAELGRTSIGFAQLLARHSVITLPWSGHLAGPGYVGTRSGALGFSVTLERVSGGTVEVMRP